MESDDKQRAVAVVKHAAWKAAHAAGQTNYGRLLMRGGRHKNKRREAERKRCRERSFAED